MTGAGQCRRARNSANVAGMAPSSRVGEGEEAIEPIAERVELRLRPVVRAAADDRLARVEEQVQHRLVPAREVAGQRRSCRRATSTTAAASASAAAAARAARAWSCTASARARRRYCSHRGSRRFSAAETGTSSTSLVPGLVGAVVGEEVRLQRRLDELRARPCASRRTAARRSTRPGSRSARARRRDRPRTRTGRIGTTPARRPTAAAIASVSDSSCASNWARGSVDAYGCRRTSSSVHGGVSQA